MTRGVHHVTVVATDPARLIGFLSDVLGLAVGERRVVHAGSLGPLFEGAADEVASTVLGEGSRGLVEVVEVLTPRNAPAGSPPSGSVPGPGPVALSFGVDDVPRAIEVACTRFAAEVVGESVVRYGEADFAVGVLRIGGVVVQLIGSVSSSDLGAG